MGSSWAETDSPGGVSVKYKVHWHVLLTHFPISAFMGAFLFMGLHVITLNDSFVLSANICLFAGTAVMVPVMLTGWFTWRRGYKSFKSRLFLNKMRIAAGMMALSVAFVIYELAYPSHFLISSHSSGNADYFAVTSLLMLGSVAEGVLGGSLHHR